MIDAAERFGPSRPIAATKQFLLVALWLSQATAHLGRAARGLQDTTGWIAATGGTADAPQRIVETTVRWTDAAARLAAVSNRLDAAFAHLHGALIAGSIRLDRVGVSSPVQAVAAKRPAVAEAGDAPLFSVEPRAEAAVVAGARRISRGRAPPFARICTL